MRFPQAPLLLADFFDRWRLQLNDGIVNWLTPVWILCVGAAAGLILCAALWALFRILSLIPGVGTLDESPKGRWLAIGVLTFLFLAIAEGFGIAGHAPLRGFTVDQLLGIAGTLVLSFLLAMAVAMAKRSHIFTPQPPLVHPSGRPWLHGRSCPCLQGVQDV